MKVCFATLVLLALSTQAGCDNFFNRPQPLGKAAKFEILVASPINSQGAIPATDPITKAPLFLNSPASVTTTDVSTIQRSTDSQRRPALAVTLTPGGKQRMAMASRNALGKQLAFVVNGRLVSAPRVNAEIAMGQFIIEGLTQEEFDRVFEELTQ